MAKIGRPRSCTCGECFKCKRADYMREWWRNKPVEYRRAHIAKRDQDEVRRQQREAQPDRRKRYPEKFRARHAVSNALRDGRLKREPCEVCGGEPTQAHHDDYSKPLEVRWLCNEHHWEHHREENDRAQAA